MPGGEKKAGPRPGPASDDHYLPGDPIPAPEALEGNSDSIWDLWHRTQRAHEAGYAETASAPVVPQQSSDPYAPTAPARLTRAEAAEVRPPSPKPPTINDAMVEVRRNNRVCPNPARWQQLYEMLPNRTANRPTPPLVGVSWQATPSLSKRMCLREHLAWAEAHQSLPQVLDFLKQLPEEEWHHMGDSLQPPGGRAVRRP